MDPTTFTPPSHPKTPALLPWSRSHRLYPLEQSRGGYMPVELVVAAVLATGYKGPISLEVFNASLNRPGADVAGSHALRGIQSLQKVYDVAIQLAPFWRSEADSRKAISRVAHRLQLTKHKL